jgi:hypothetical protein
MKVYSPKNNYKLDQILFAAKIYNQPINHVEVSFDHKNKQFQEIYPQWSLPALETNNGTFVFGFNTILVYLATTQL